MAYATAAEAIQDGEIIYGRGNVSAKRTGNSEYIYSRNGATAMDASTVTNRNAVPNNFKDLDDATRAKIARVRRKVALDAEADDAVAVMFPFLEAAVANDSKEEEELNFGESFSSEEGEVEASDEDSSFEASYAASLKASVDYWNGVKKRNAERTKAASTGRYQPVERSTRKAAKAADSTSRSKKKIVLHTSIATLFS